MQKSAESAKRSHYFFPCRQQKDQDFFDVLTFLYLTRRCGVHSMEIPARMRRPGAIRPGRYLRPSLGGYPNCFLYTRLK